MDAKIIQALAARAWSQSTIVHFYCTALAKVLSFYHATTKFGIHHKDGQNTTQLLAFDQAHFDSFSHVMASCASNSTSLATTWPQDIAFCTSKPHPHSLSLFTFTLSLDKLFGEEVHYLFDPQLFSTTLINQMHQHWMQCLLWGLEHPNQALSEFCLLTACERQQIQIEHRANQVQFPKAGILNWLQSQVSQHPEQLAILSQTTSYTFKALETNSSRLAHQLWSLLQPIQEAQNQPRIAICMQATSEALLCLYAILKINGCMIPLNPNAPIARQQRILEDAKADIVITDCKFTEIFQTHCQLKVISYPQLSSTKPTAPLPNIVYQEKDELYIMYTSGSQGQPKGILVNHQNLTNIIYGACRALDLQGQTSLLGLTQSIFDPFMFDVFGALYLGSTYIVVEEDIRHAPKALACMIERYQPDFILATPSLWRSFCDYLKPMPHQPFLATAGEALDPALAKKLYALSPNLWNLFGPTETSIYVSYAKVTPKDIHIGSPFANYETYILNPNGQVLPPGIEGELYVGGPGLAKYFANPELQRQQFNCFIQQPSEFNHVQLYRSGDRVVKDHQGRIHFLGRIDQQVKIRGQRVEPREIEIQMLEHPTVQQAAVVIKEAQTAPQIVAFLVLKPPMHWFGKIKWLRDKHIQRIRSMLKKNLPNYMWPSQFIIQSKLPLTSAGKVARQTLAQTILTVKSKQLGPIPKAIDKKLKWIWTLVLSKSLPAKANFFDHGGDSMAAIQLCLEINHHFQRQLPVTWCYQYPSQHTQLQWLKENSFETEFNPLMPLRALQSNGPTLYLFHPSVAGAEVYHALTNALPTGLNIIGVNPHNLYHKGNMINDFQQLVNYYTQLIQAHPSSGPLFLGGWSFGGLLALECARQLHLTHHIAKVYIFDCLKMDKTILYGLSFLLRFRWFYQMEDANRYNRLPLWFQKQLVRSIALDFKMLYRHQMQPYPYPVDFFKATKPSLLSRISVEGPANGYEKYFNHLNIHSMDADHLHLLAPPIVDDIAKLIQKDILNTPVIQQSLTTAAENCV